MTGKHTNANQCECKVLWSAFSNKITINYYFQSNYSCYVSMHSWYIVRKRNNMGQSFGITVPYSSSVSIPMSSWKDKKLDQLEKCPILEMKHVLNWFLVQWHFLMTTRMLQRLMSNNKDVWFNTKKPHYIQWVVSLALDSPLKCHSKFQWPKRERGHVQ